MEQQQGQQQSAMAALTRSPKCQGASNEQGLVRSFVRSFGQRAAATAEPINNFIYTVVRRASGEKGLFLCHSFSAPPIERVAGFKEVL